jgi:hypothetical protein
MKRLTLKSDTIKLSDYYDVYKILLEKDLSILDNLLSKLQTSTDYLKSSKKEDKEVIIAKIAVKFNYTKQKAEVLKKVLDVPIPIFTFIIKKFFYKISLAILKGYNYSMYPSTSCGSFYIRREEVKTNKLRINWGASNANKARLIKEGVTPYEVLERDKDNNIIKHNNGEKWLMYHTERYMFWWYWSCKSIHSNTTLNYQYKPSNKKASTSKLETTTVSDGVFLLNSIPYTDKLQRYSITNF